MSMPKISIIIPVYNAEKHILKCINSLLNQTLFDLEVILVDDHGFDNSIELVKKHIKNHERKDMFRFTATEHNSGPGAARNIGINLAQGEYVAFVDSDDWIESDMYSELYEAVDLQNTDVCNCYAWLDDAQSKKSRVLKNPTLSGGDFCDEDKAAFLTDYVAYLWTFIFRRSFLFENKITFPPEKSAEDSYFIACCILCAKGMSQVPKALYHYVLHADSLSQSKNKFRHKDKLKAFERLFDFAKQRNMYLLFRPELDFVYVKKAYLSSCFDYLKNSKNPQSEVLNEIYQTLDETIPDYKSNKYYKRQIKIKLAVSFLHKMPSFSALALSNALKFSFLSRLFN